MGEARESGRCPGFCLRTGWIDGGAVTKIGNLEGGGRSLDEKKRNSTLDVPSGCGTCKWNPFILNGN